jgi:hypothetical protein
MIPAEIQDSINKVQGKIVKCDPVCDGSRHYIVTFTAAADLSKVEGAASLARLPNDTFRIHFFLEK